MPKIELSAVAGRTTCAYPSPYDAICEGRQKQALGDQVGLNQFGVNLTRLSPGAASAHQHWHKNEDEFIYVVAGEVILIEGNEEIRLKAGEAAGFKAGVEIGHMLINKSDNDCLILEVGARCEEEACTYTDPNVDMSARKEAGGEWQFNKKDGTAL